MKKRMLVLFSALALILGLGGAVAVSADEADAVSAYMMSYVQEANSPNAEIGDASSIYVPDPDFSRKWLLFANGIRMNRQSDSGTSVLQLAFRDSFTKGDVSLSCDEWDSVEGYNLLSILVKIEMEDGEKSDYYNVHVDMELSDTEAVFTETWIAANRWQEIIIDVSAVEEIETLSITVDCIDTVTPKSILFAPVCFKESAENSNFERYHTDSFEVSGCRLTEENGVLTVIPFGTTAFLEGRLVLGEIPKQGTQAFMLVTLAGEIRGGTVTMGYHSARTGSMVYVDTEPLPLRNGRNVYSFPFLASDDMISYRLFFRNVEFEKDGIRLDSVDFIFTEDVPAQATGNGIVTGIALNRENGRLTIGGSVSQEVMLAHKKSELVVYAVPYTASSHIERERVIWDGVELTRSKLYMNFELVLDAETTARYAGTHMFYVAVEEEGHDPILISQPRGVDHEVHTKAENSIVGIEGAAAVGVFESNASHVIVGIPFDRLVIKVVKPDQLGKEAAQITSAETLRCFAPDGTVIWLDQALLEEIFAEISFYNSANVEVYLQITDADTVFAHNISRQSAWDMEVYSSILKEIFSVDSQLMEEAVSGVILGEASAYSEEFFADISAYEYAFNLSSLMQVTYNTVHLRLDSSKISVIVPYLAGGDYNEIVNQMVAFHNSRTGGLSWYVMYSFADADTAYGGYGQGEDKFDAVLLESERLMDASISLGVTGGATGCLYFYIPNPWRPAEEITLFYNSFCAAVENDKPMAVFLSVRDLLVDGKEMLYRQLKNIRKEEKNSVIENIEAEYITETDEETFDGALYTVWDFSKLYHNDGWLSGGVVSGCSTGRSEIFSRYNATSVRVLRTKVYSNLENSMASAIVIRNLNQAMDLGFADDVIFRFSVAETAENSTLIFVMGDERIRAEYTLTDVQPGVVHTVRCPISAFSGKDHVAYIGVMIYSGESAVLEIESVKLSSRTLEPDEMAALFTPTVEQHSERGAEGYFIAGVLGVLTIFAAALLIRRDKEEEAEGRKTVSNGRKRR